MIDGTLWDGNNSSSPCKTIGLLVSKGHMIKGNLIGGSNLSMPWPIEAYLEKLSLAGHVLTDDANLGL